MSDRVQSATLVLGRRARAPAPPSALWEQLAAVGWLPLAPSRIVIQIGQGCRSPLALETARSVAGFLNERMSAATVCVLDGAASPGEWAPLPLYNVLTNEAYSIAGVAATRGLRAPALWFERSYLITVAAAYPHRAMRMAGVLDAQADPLRQLRNQYPPEVLTYEAHRLNASDLSIACGTAVWNESTAERWWAVSPNDVAVDRAVAAAAGLDPARLPVLQAFARHELLAPKLEVDGSLPELRGYLASACLAQLHRARSRMAVSRRALAHDLSVMRRTLHKIPGFVRRRLAARRGAA